MIQKILVYRQISCFLFHLTPAFQPFSMFRGFPIVWAWTLVEEMALLIAAEAKIKAISSFCRPGISDSHDIRRLSDTSPRVGRARAPSSSALTSVSCPASKLAGFLPSDHPWFMSPCLQPSFSDMSSPTSDNACLIGFSFCNTVPRVMQQLEWVADKRL